MKTFKEFIAEAISRKPSVQRAPDLSARARQQRQAREDRRAAARDRVSDKIDALIGSDEERSAAAAARRNQPKIQKELRRKSTSDRMAAAAKKLGLDEAEDETEKGTYTEEYKDLTPEKEERVKERVGELARGVQVKSARVKELRKKPFVKFRPKVKSEIQANIKSAKKDAKLVRNASDALIRTSVDRSAKIQKQIEDSKRRENS